MVGSAPGNGAILVVSGLKGEDDFQSNRFICLGMRVAKDQRESEKMNGAKQEVRSNPPDGKQNVVERKNAPVRKGKGGAGWFPAGVKEEVAGVYQLRRGG